MNPRTPSATYWTASAASSTPSTRVTTFAPVRRSTRPSCADRRSASQVRPSTTAVIANTRPSLWISAPACPTRISRLAIAPGPAISGIASGKTLTSSRERASSSSSSVSRWCGAASTMPTAIRNNSTPPAIRNASMLIPSLSSTKSPSVAKPKSTIPATVTALRATRFCSARERSPTRPRNTGAMPTGSMTTKSVMNARSASSDMGEMLARSREGLRQRGRELRPRLGGGARALAERLAAERAQCLDGFPCEGKRLLAHDREQPVDGLVAPGRSRREQRRAREPPALGLRQPLAQRRERLGQPRLAERQCGGLGELVRLLEEGLHERPLDARVEAQQREQALRDDAGLWVGDERLE